MNQTSPSHPSPPNKTPITQPNTQKTHQTRSSARLQNDKAYITPAKVEEEHDKNYHKNNTTHAGKEEIKPCRLQFKSGSKRGWTKDEDELLKALVEQNGAKDWTTLALNFQNRGGKQCRERWHNHLKDGVKKDEWTNEQEWLLALGVKAYGHKWSMISKFIPGRTDNTIKNHWNCKMRPKKFPLQQKILQLISTQELYELSSIEKTLLQVIRNQNEFVCWEKEEIRKSELREKCKQALIDFYRVQKMIEKGQLYLQGSPEASQYDSE